MVVKGKNPYPKIIISRRLISTFKTYEVSSIFTNEISQCDYTSCGKRKIAKEKVDSCRADNERF